MFFLKYHSSTFDLFQLCCKVPFVGVGLTRSATLHSSSDSWSKHSTVPTPAGEEQACPTRRSVFLNAVFAATWNPSGELSSGTPNKPCNQKAPPACFPFQPRWKFCQTYHALLKEILPLVGSGIKSGSNRGPRGNISACGSPQAPLLDETNKPFTRRHFYLTKLSKVC